MSLTADKQCSRAGGAECSRSLPKPEAQIPKVALDAVHGAIYYRDFTGAIKSILIDKLGTASLLDKTIQENAPGASLIGVARETVKALIELYSLTNERLIPALAEQSKEFIRLKFVEQAGAMWITTIFNTSKYDRYAHTIGTHHVAKMAVLRALQFHRAPWQFEERLSAPLYLYYWAAHVVLINGFLIGALFHDLGHLPFSHLLEKIEIKTSDTSEKNIIVSQVILNILYEYSKKSEQKSIELFIDHILSKDGKNRVANTSSLVGAPRHIHEYISVLHLERLIRELYKILKKYYDEKIHLNLCKSTSMPIYDNFKDFHYEEFRYALGELLYKTIGNPDDSGGKVIEYLNNAFNMYNDNKIYGMMPSITEILRYTINSYIHSTETKDKNEACEEYMRKALVLALLMYSLWVAQLLLLSEYGIEVSANRARALNEFIDKYFVPVLRSLSKVVCSYMGMEYAGTSAGMGAGKVCFEDDSEALMKVNDSLKEVFKAYLKDFSTIDDIDYIDIDRLDHYSRDAIALGSSAVNIHAALLRRLAAPDYPGAAGNVSCGSDYESKWPAYFFCAVNEDIKRISTIVKKHAYGSIIGNMFQTIFADCIAKAYKDALKNKNIDELMELLVATDYDVMQKVSHNANAGLCRRLPQVFTSSAALRLLIRSQALDSDPIKLDIAKFLESLRQKGWYIVDNVVVSESIKNVSYRVYYAVRLLTDVEGSCYPIIREDFIDGSDRCDTIARIIDEVREALEKGTMLNQHIAENSSVIFFTPTTISIYPIKQIIS